MNVFVLLGLGAAAGLLAGMFGVGGGFLATPLLIFVGIPPAGAVPSRAHPGVAHSGSARHVPSRGGNRQFSPGPILPPGAPFRLTGAGWLGPAPPATRPRV